MEWSRNISINEYYFMVLMCPIILTHYGLDDGNGNKTQLSRERYKATDIIQQNMHLRHTTTDKYDNKCKRWQFQFDDGNTI